MLNANTEGRILKVMRKTLTSVIKDATPRPGKPHPLSQETLDDIRQALSLIAVREQELNRSQLMQPKFADELNSGVVSISAIKQDKD